MPGSLFPRSASLMPETPVPQPRRAVPIPRTPSPPLQTAKEPEPPVPEEADPVNEEADATPRREHSIGRGRRKSTTAREGDAGPSAVRGSSRHSDSSSQAASSSRRSLEDAPEPVARLKSAKGKERACDTSGEIRVRGKERELREAREEHARNAHERDDGERDQDKKRIRMLEEEVARLRAEVCRLHPEEIPNHRS